jgi:hypothetical protein
MVIDQQIGRLQPVVRSYLLQVGVFTDILITEPAWDRERQKETRDALGRWDAVRDYFNQPADGVRGSKISQGWFEHLMNLIEQGVGMYEARRASAWREKFNPLTWIAGVLKAPAFVLERAGLLGQGRSKLLELYLWIVRLLFLLGLIFAAAKLGLSVPWQQVAALLH